MNQKIILTLNKLSSNCITSTAMTEEIFRLYFDTLQLAAGRFNIFKSRLSFGVLQRLLMPQ